MVVERQMMEDEMTFAAIRVEVAANASKRAGITRPDVPIASNAVMAA
ncbi:MAG TPA: hypothetical protein PKD07_19995 [Microthrixaceae bacterium]|nr:hypothetical protein [Microthrixaceae bacterium]